MKFLKTIQKRASEHAVEQEATAGAERSDHQEVASQEGNRPPGLLSVTDLRIGAPKLERKVEVEALAPVGGKVYSPVLPDPSTGLERVREFEVNIERVNPRVVSITQPRSPYCEEYRNLRTQIMHKGRKRKLQAIVVASVGPSEGKSVTALNLSWLFAQTDGVRALIIDSDLRRPSLANYLGIETNVGLSEVLTGGASLLDSVIRLRPSGLYMLPGGSARSDVAELISGPRFAEILNEARTHFDFIIIDAPPLGIFTDASLLINLADGAMLVIRANHTKYKDVDRILDSLPRERMLGTILNQSEVPLMDESYYKYGFYEGREPIKA